MDRWRNKVAVVTGASAGIGENIARRLVEEGLQVVGIARRSHLVEEISKQLTNQTGKLHALKCDITKEEEVKNAFMWIKDNLGPVHILINNAGIIKNSTFVEGDPKDWKQILDLNLYGLAVCTHEAVKQMREAEIAGHIININSVAGHKVSDFSPNTFNMYAPSKYGVTAMTEVLRQELRYFNTKIKVTSISPGLVGDTDIFNAGKYTEMTQDAIQTFPHLLPEDVTEGIIYALSTKPHVQVHELMIKPLGEVF